ncbi:MAG: Nif3-like dinuclear metal center hexameric protein [Clostridia bacterium]|nr:Nif3-like dinuclear metal center hexameric protein [Clostridia bacterium]
MKAKELMNELFALAKERDYSKSCDTCKAGDPEQEVTRVAVSMFATPDVVRRASAWGAQLLIVHEPTYYDHMDVHSDDSIECEKRRLLEESGLTVWRFHDHPHWTSPDIIAEGELKYLDLDGDVERTNIFDLVRVHLHEPMTPRALAKRIEERLGIAHVRVCGAADTPCTVVSGMFGTPGGVFEELQRAGSEIVLTGEACEWKLGEYARDAAQLGHKKALIIMGHIGSERDGMRYTVDLLHQMHPELACEYFECGEVYTYTDAN